VIFIENLDKRSILTRVNSFFAAAAGILTEVKLLEGIKKGPGSPEEVCSSFRGTRIESFWSCWP